MSFATINYGGSTDQIKANLEDDRYITNLNELSRIFSHINVPLCATLELGNLIADLKTSVGAIVASYNLLKEVCAIDFEILTRITEAEAGAKI